jgi:hypothetical protein
MAMITKEDVIDAIEEEREDRLDLLTEYWQAEMDEQPNKDLASHAYDAAKLLYERKAYQDVVDWLDAIGLQLEKSEGEESEAYVAYLEDDRLEEMRMNALERSSLEEEGAEYDMDDEDEE